MLDIEGSSCRLNYRANAKSEIRAFLGCILDYFCKNFMCEVSTVCKFKRADSTVIAGFYHSLGYFRVFVIKHRNHRSLSHLGEHLLLIEFCHFV